MGFGFTQRVPLPAGVYGFIAGGDTFDIPITDPRPDDTTVHWTCNVRAGTEVVFAVLTSGRYGDMGFLAPITVGESAQNGCLSGGSYGVTSAAGPVATGGGSSGELTGTGGNGTPAGSPGAGTGTGASTGGEGAKSNTGTIVGAVVGSVLGAALLLAVLLWYLLRRRRAVRTNYAVDLQDDSDGPAPVDSVVTPLTFRHDSSQTTTTLDEKGRPGGPFSQSQTQSLSGPTTPSAPSHSQSPSHSHSHSQSHSQGYTSAQLSASAHDGSAGPSEFGSGSRPGEPGEPGEPEIDAEAPLRHAGAAPPPSYDHVLWVTRPEGRRLRPRQPEAQADDKAPSTGLALV